MQNISPLSEREVSELRSDFPILNQDVNGHPLVYLDNAATTQKPQVVIDAISDYYQRYNANVHRGIHQLSEAATLAYENARQTIQTFLKAQHAHEIIFCRGTTEAINLVATSFVAPRLQAGDEILVTTMEHHSNIVPWQLLCQRSGATLRAIPLQSNGELDLDAYAQLLTPKTKFLAITHVSNSLGTINPIHTMIKQAHDNGTLVLVDGAQAVPHEAVDVMALGCDFYAFSGHKLYGPTGIGALYAKEAHLEEMVPYQAGGEMIAHVTFEETVYAAIPYKFEAGTPNIVGAIGLARAIEYLLRIGLDRIAVTEMQLYQRLRDACETISGIRYIGDAPAKAPIFTFVLDNIHAHDVGTVMNSFGVAVRAGHLCTIPAIEFFQEAAVTRAAISFYNTASEVDKFVWAIEQVKKIMGG